MENFIRLCKKLHSSEKSFRRFQGLSALSNINTRTKIIASIAVFSALYGVIRLVPLGPMIGLSQYFSVSDSLAPLYGILLGPFTGGISIVIGTALGWLMGKPVSFLGLDFLPALINTVAIGFLIKRQWKFVVILNVVLLALFILSPYSLLMVEIPGIFYFPFLWMHILALIVLISPLRSKAVSWIETLKSANIPWGIAILAFIGTMMQHLAGNLVYQLVVGQPIGGLTAEGFQTIWTAAFFAYPLERSALIIITVLVGAPLVRILKKSLFVDNAPKTTKGS
jgi:hypothetical protein